MSCKHQSMYLRRRDSSFRHHVHRFVVNWATVQTLEQNLPLAQLMRIGGVGEPAAKARGRHRFLHTFESAWLVDDFHPPSSFPLRRWFMLNYRTKPYA